MSLAVFLPYSSLRPDAAVLAAPSDRRDGLDRQLLRGGEGQTRLTTYLFVNPDAGHLQP